jgi:histidinol phosphatase-like PHP family hydrolase
MLPTELVRRLAVIGYTTVAITDHVDASNIVSVIEAVSRVRDSAEKFGVTLLPGVEITHVPPDEVQALAALAKRHGADVVVVHGETPMEPVAPGTNRAACACREVDVLAHPGMITREDADLAAACGVALEITSRGGHNRTNGHVVHVARMSGCRLVVDSDAHSPHDLLDAKAKELIARGAGLSPAEVGDVLTFNIRDLLG